MPPSASNAPASASPGVPKSAVVVDDEEGYLDLLGQLLGEHLSCPVHCFSRSTEALGALPTLNPGLIVADYHMPGPNGFEFLREVLKTHPEVPAIIITAHGIEATPEWSARLPNLRGIVRKPFRWAELAPEVARLWNEGASTTGPRD